ncbi:carboxy-S-adenosyl-L-methionine synthase CmoA [Helicobacter mustelae]|uniref:Carboxy-S-adenosyl-L-methionine synthase n=1 Tax=Helicobacter mustelae (strain ATCC 43772 / CCUG 25715 / CIP 103759 / LMG 18044 / NCTC 12198 / R85-136P) TaxID=679897 RepID=D3UJ67_HELM1|nr:carboxy-S-adenosyl-L-methionine synthase CmoA [Helicobacter mustelae]CBG40542.1 putative SAM dependent methyltransferase [Helicobacter mustelae 12198]SQH72040.1 SAM dependent methyltransferase [Helicobacter mustelae]STP13183.1 SAM dependent methyltransferase [Helicobacter mustelae]
MLDQIFTQDQESQFDFNAEVASVFDDMLSRSIPYYKNTLELCIDFIKNHLKHLSSPIIYDLGSSTGNFLLALHERLQLPDAKMYGIDSSLAMIQTATQKARAYAAPIEFLCEDFLQKDFGDCDVIVAHYTLQFVRPLHREKLVKKISESLQKKQGIFLLSEKMSSGDKWMDKAMIERYYQFKQEQGYSQNEITKKREALENVLIPYSLEENFEMLRNAGFQSIEVLFKWVNFGTLIAKF